MTRSTCSGVDCPDREAVRPDKSCRGALDVPTAPLRVQFRLTPYLAGVLWVVGRRSLAFSPT
jgi:hypothetical protein